MIVAELTEKLVIVAHNKKTGEKTPITDLYWFEENGVSNFNGDGFYADYTFTLEAKELEFESE